MCHKDIHSRYLPRRDRALLGGETDADLDDAAAVSLVGDGVTFVVDLLERFLHGAVEFQVSVFIRMSILPFAVRTWV